MNQQIDLAPHTKFREIDAGFNRTAGGRQELTLILGLEVIQVGSVPVIRGANTMSSPMHKERSITSIGNDFAHNIIGIASLDQFAIRQMLANKSDSSITGITHQGKDLTL